KAVIAEAVRSSPSSVMGMTDENNEPDYAPVYFYDIKSSALVMSVTVYCKSGLRTEIVKDDIHTRVFEALRKNGIEIPYEHMNVIMDSDRPGMMSQ
ncbi:MAG: hypothetical protein IKR73_02115, partial [Oscillospiraceae bacterium]|nr:hypothetical protein [Oscillospiraceae bacterium]